MGSKFGIPTLLIFLLLGMGFRTIGITYMTEEAVQMIGLMAMSVIIFTGGMETKFNDIKPVLLPGILLSTFGVLITAMLTGVFIWWISGFKFTNIEFPLIIALLLAATMSSTDSASVFSILKSNNIKLKHNLRPMLEL
ncbi:MAG: cation:proton antiporter [Bacteroidales bacterium]|nr:cation:proton antiporter [Bacteroidales bacterium]